MSRSQMLSNIMHYWKNLQKVIGNTRYPAIKTQISHPDIVNFVIK